MAFKEQEEKVHPKLMAIGKVITSRCQGVPLAIRTLGSMLYGETGESEWLAIQNHEIWALKQNENDIMPVIRLSYNHLQVYVKQCFAYCSLFPKGRELKKTELVHYWMAQGYLQSSFAREELEDIGDRYFKELVCKSFFQANDNCYKMHDLIHDLAQLVAGGEGTTVSNSAENVSESVVHMSLAYSLDDIPSQLLGKKNTRTLVVSYYKGPTGGLDTSLSSFGRLRVLNIREGSSMDVPGSIGCLKHLRYLHIPTDVQTNTLPDSICDLHNLQTLKLMYCREFPRDFNKLISLRHLEIFGWHIVRHMPLRIGKMNSLRTLPFFTVGNEETGPAFGRLSELYSLNNLRGHLEILKLQNARANGASQAKEANLKVNRNLRGLTLSWGDGVTDDCDEIILEKLQPHSNLEHLKVHGYSGTKFSGWLTGSFLPNLIQLEIKQCRRCQYLPSFSQLPLLMVLKLESLDDVEYIDNGDGDSATRTQTFFPSLKELILEELSKLKGWWKNDQVFVPSFSCLSTLNIANCPQLKSPIPWYPCIEEIDLRETG